MDPYYAWYLVTNYGKTCKVIIDDAKANSTALNEASLILAEAKYCIENEMTSTLEDFFVRRTGRLYFNIDSVIEHKERILDYFSKTLDWSEDRVKEEIENLNMLLKDATTYYQDEMPV